MMIMMMMMMMMVVMMMMMMMVMIYLITNGGRGICCGEGYGFDIMRDWMEMFKCCLFYQWRLI